MQLGNNYNKLLSLVLHKASIITFPLFNQKMHPKCIFRVNNHYYEKRRGHGWSTLALLAISLFFLMEFAATTAQLHHGDEDKNVYLFIPASQETAHSISHPQENSIAIPSPQGERAVNPTPLGGRRVLALQSLLQKEKADLVEGQEVSFEGCVEVVAALMDNRPILRFGLFFSPGTFCKAMTLRIPGLGTVYGGKAEPYIDFATDFPLEIQEQLQEDISMVFSALFTIPPPEKGDNADLYSMYSLMMRNLEHMVETTHTLPTFTVSITSKGLQREDPARIDYSFPRDQDANNIFCIWCRNETAASQVTRDCLMRMCIWGFVTGTPLDLPVLPLIFPQRVPALEVRTHHIVQQLSRLKSNQKIMEELHQYMLEKLRSIGGEEEELVLEFLVLPEACEQRLAFARRILDASGKLLREYAEEEEGVFEIWRALNESYEGLQTTIKDFDGDDTAQLLIRIDTFFELLEASVRAITPELKERSSIVMSFVQERVERLIETIPEEFQKKQLRQMIQQLCKLLGDTDNAIAREDGIAAFLAFMEARAVCDYLESLIEIIELQTNYIAIQSSQALEQAL